MLEAEDHLNDDVKGIISFCTGEGNDKLLLYFTKKSTQREYKIETESINCFVLLFLKNTKLSESNEMSK